MFTGIIEGVRRIETIRASGERGLVVVDLGALAEGVRVGDSVAVSGCCLTVTELRSSRASFDVSGETLSRSVLGEKRAGDAVNIERALRVGDRLGGHFVQGHVDAVGVVSRKDVLPGQWTVEFAIPPPLAATMALKGSVAVDGVSLTIADLQPDRFSVALVPHTIESTTLKNVAVRDRVNVEGDILAKYVARALAQSRPTDSGVTRGFLAEHGFAE